MSKHITLSGLWTSKDKNGNPMMSGNLNAVTKIYLFKNTYKKEGSKEPDYLLKLAPIEKENAQPSPQKDLIDDCPF